MKPAWQDWRRQARQSERMSYLDHLPDDDGRPMPWFGCLFITIGVIFAIGVLVYVFRVVESWVTG